MISLGRWGETMKPACMTLSHSLCRAATFISQSFLTPSLPLPLCLPLNLTLSPPRGNASIHLCLYCHPHIFNCHSEEHSSPSWWSWFRVRGIRCPHFPKNETAPHLFSFSPIWKKNARNVCRRCLKVTGRMRANRWEISSFADAVRKRWYLNQLSALEQLRADNDCVCCLC